jgi:outer membrane protein
MRIKIHPKAIAALAAFAIAATFAPATLAADLTDIGFLDQAALSNISSFQSANRELASYKQQLDKQFAQQMRGVKDSNAQARIAQQFQNRLADRQRELMGPLFQRAQVAIASVASSKNLSVIVDKRIIVFGGQDVTRNVIDLLTGPGDPIPPVTTPPPSSVGYVDQRQIDVVPRIKAVNDEFLKFSNDEQAKAQQAIHAAKTDEERRKIFQDARKTIADKQTQLIQPLVEQTRAAIATVAKKHGLILVIDRSNLIFGGLDITSDVTSALK